jgi:4-hydroxy-3-methylbut-2-enyl diphosphate reductase
VLIGHAGHDEVVGTLGEAPQQMLLVETVEDVDRLEVPDPEKIAYLTQTTLSVNEVSRIVRRLRERFPCCVGPASEDICYATQNRQEALKALLPLADVVLVVGSQNSSNSRRLAEIAREQGAKAHLIDSVAEIDLVWFLPADCVLVTAGASAPEELVSDCVHFLRRQFGATVEERPVRDEAVVFPLPLEVR